jgi:hypothetical protein
LKMPIMICIESPPITTALMAGIVVPITSGTCVRS